MTLARFKALRSPSLSESSAQRQRQAAAISKNSGESCRQCGRPHTRAPGNLSLTSLCEDCERRREEYENLTNTLIRVRQGLACRQPLEDACRYAGLSAADAERLLSARHEYPAANAELSLIRTWLQLNA